MPEYRLGLAAPGFLLAIVGLISKLYLFIKARELANDILVVWGVQLQNAVEGKWNITPVCRPANLLVRRSHAQLNNNL